jgi:hypothetical protein
VAGGAEKSANALARIEDGADLHPGTSDAIRDVLKASGVFFFVENGYSPGVRLRRISSPSDI